MSGKILVIRGGAIGDFILTLPVLSALREGFRKSEIHVLGYPKVAQLALKGGLVDHVQSIEARALAGFFARDGELSSVLANYFSTFNIIISYLYDPDEIFQANVRRCSKTAQFIQGPYRPVESEDLHATDVFLKPLERLALFGCDPVPKIKLNFTSAVTDRIVIHPGSGSENKNWPEENWSTLLKLLSREPIKLLMVGGEADAKRLADLPRSVPPERMELAINVPLSELAERLATSAFFVGHDSGITHLANAVGLPGIVLWGPSNEQIWRPRSEKMRLLRSPGGLNQLSVEEVFDAIIEGIQLNATGVPRSEF